ncbi:MAG: twin-arginine translocase subunit TatC [Candidatus Riflebacteria bacterium]|nr:twin-arginine translocase subunit TatC [Candidatus Riflebacteria bacterium]
MTSDNTKITENKEAPITEHLEEIRYRVILCFIVFTAFFFISWNYSDFFASQLIKPLKSCKPDVKLAALSVTETFFTSMKLAFYCSLAFSTPFFLWHSWKFVEPGLKPREKNIANILIIPSMLCFIFGSAFCYLFLLPVSIKFLLTGMGDNFIAVFSYSSYVDFSILFLTLIGIVFQAPLLMIFLDLLGLFPVERMKKNRKITVLGAFIIGAILSPPDVFSQILVSLPLIILIEIGFILINIIRKYIPNLAE